MVYLLLSLRYYLKYRAFIVQELSYADNLQFTWVRNFLIACFLYFFSTITLDGLRLLGFDIGYQDTWWYYLLFALIFYYIGITGYANSIEQKKKFEVDFYRYQTEETARTDGYEVNANLEETVNETATSTKLDTDLQATDSPVPPEWKAKLEKAMVLEKLYRNPQLTLSDLALS